MTMFVLMCNRLSIHNVHWLLALMRRARDAIIADCYPRFLRDYFDTLYNGDKSSIPEWAVGALRTVGIDLLEN